MNRVEWIAMICYVEIAYTKLCEAGGCTTRPCWGHWSEAHALRRRFWREHYKR